MIILHVLRTNSVAFIMSRSRTLPSLYYQVKLTWFSGRRLTTSMSRTFKQIKYQLLMNNCFFSNWLRHRAVLRAICMGFLYFWEWSGHCRCDVRVTNVQRVPPESLHVRRASTGHSMIATKPVRAAVHICIREPSPTPGSVEPLAWWIWYIDITRKTGNESPEL